MKKTQVSRMSSINYTLVNIINRDGYEHHIEIRILFAKDRSSATISGYHPVHLKWTTNLKSIEPHIPENKYFWLLELSTEAEDLVKKMLI